MQPMVRRVSEQQANASLNTLFNSFPFPIHENTCLQSSRVLRYQSIIPFELCFLISYSSAQMSSFVSASSRRMESR